MTSTEARIILGLKESDYLKEDYLEAYRTECMRNLKGASKPLERAIRKDLEAVDTLLYYGRVYGKW